MNFIKNETYEEMKKRFGELISTYNYYNTTNIVAVVCYGIVFNNKNKKINEVIGTFTYNISNKSDESKLEITLKNESFSLNNEPTLTMESVGCKLYTAHPHIIFDCRNLYESFKNFNKENYDNYIEIIRRDLIKDKIKNICKE